MQHHTIICDECGTFPIPGVRYKSTKIYDHDCCEVCIRDNHYSYSSASTLTDKKQQSETVDSTSSTDPAGSDDNNTTPDFVAFENHVSYSESKRHGPKKENRIRASTAQDAQEQLKNGRTASLAIFGFHDTPSRQQCDEICDFLNSNSFITKVEIHMTNRSLIYEEAIQALTEGLISNESIRMIAWMLPCTVRKHLPNATAMQRLIREKPNLEVLLYMKPPYRNGCGCDEDHVVEMLLEALQQSKIQTFRFDTCSSVQSETVQQMAYKTLQMNHSLKQFYINFEDNGQRHQEMMYILTTLNRNPQWVKGWTNLKATAYDRIQIVQDIFSETTHDPETAAQDPSPYFNKPPSPRFFVNKAGAAPFLFHLFQTFPSALEMQN